MKLTTSIITGLLFSSLAYAQPLSQSELQAINDKLHEKIGANYVSFDALEIEDGLIASGALSGEVPVRLEDTTAKFGVGFDMRGSRMSADLRVDGVGKYLGHGMGLVAAPLGSFSEIFEKIKATGNYDLGITFHADVSTAHEHMAKLEIALILKREFDAVIKRAEGSVSITGERLEAHAMVDSTRFVPMVRAIATELYYALLQDREPNVEELGNALRELSKRAANEVVSDDEGTDEGSL